MAPPSKISQLPQDLRDELVDRILDSGFGDYDGHAEWLAAEIDARGIEVEGGISRAAIARLGKRHKSISRRVQEIKAMELEFNADPIRTNRTTNQLLQMLAFAKTRDAYDGSVDVDEDFLKDMALTIGRLEKAAALSEDRERDIRADERAKAIEEAAKAAEKAAKDAGMSDDDVAGVGASVRIYLPDNKR